MSVIDTVIQINHLQQTPVFTSSCITESGHHQGQNNVIGMPHEGT
jgi:hypothetical protein